MLDEATDDELARATVPVDATSPPTLLLSGGAGAVWRAPRLCEPAVE
ncbi:MAG: hypothetical protein ACOCSD_01345 [Halolamina sp.]